MTITINGNLKNGESAVVHIDGKYIVLNAGEIDARIPLSDTVTAFGQINQNNTTVTATYIQKTGTVYKYGDSTDGLDDISATSPEGTKYQDYIEEAVAKGTNPWVLDPDGYAGTGAEGLSLKLVRRNNGALGFDIAQQGDQLRLFTSTQFDAQFTFSLLLVSKSDKTKGKFIENVSYKHPTFTDVPAGEVEGGDDYYWNIETGLTSAVLANCQIYLIVTMYEGIPDTSPGLYNNIIKIK